jgi:ABC-type uncharacterized transport system permease subunit
MSAILWTSFLVSGGSYLAACVLFLALARQRPVTRLGPKWPLRLLGLGAALQLLYLVVFSVVDHRCPVYSLHTALGIVSLVGVLTYAVLSRGRRLEALGGFVAASATIFMVTARSIAERPPEPNHRWLMAIHITSNLLGGGVLLIAGGAAAFYLWNERRLRHRHTLGQGTKLPPLESLDTVVHRLLWIGLPLLSIGMLTGHLAIKRVDVVTTGDELRAAVSVASWLLLLAVLGLRQFARWRGRRPAVATLIGAIAIFAVIALYVGRALLGGGI